jgi:hypothetical protein
METALDVLAVVFTGAGLTAWVAFARAPGDRRLC